MDYRTMITKKERVMGMELQRELSLIEAIRSSFDVTAPGAPVIRRGTEQYRQYVKKIVEEGRGLRWRGVTSGSERELRGIKRAKAARERGGF